jgi:hypothetical protein
VLGRKRRDPLSGSGLRERIFDIDPAEVGLRPDGSRHVWGVVVDQATSSGMVSLVSLIDGTTSLAMGGGGGVVGGGAHEQVAQASEALVYAAEHDIDALSESAELGHPPLGSTRIWALTYSGLRMGQADTDALDDRAHPLWRLNMGALGVLRALTLIEG